MYNFIKNISNKSAHFVVCNWIYRVIRFFFVDWLNMFIANFSICLNSSTNEANVKQPKRLQNGPTSKQRLDLAMDIRFKSKNIYARTVAKIQNATIKRVSLKPKIFENGTQSRMLSVYKVKPTKYSCTKCTNDARAQWPDTCTYDSNMWFYTFHV